MSIRPVGDVEYTTGGLLIIRCPGAGEPPSIGANLVDDRLDPVGRVVDVFGPVSRPYLAVTPVGDEVPASLVGARVYVRGD